MLCKLTVLNSCVLGRNCWPLNLIILHRKQPRTSSNFWLCGLGILALAGHRVVSCSLKDYNYHQTTCTGPAPQASAWCYFFGCPVMHASTISNLHHLCLPSPYVIIPCLFSPRRCPPADSPEPSTWRAAWQRCGTAVWSRSWNRCPQRDQSLQSWSHSSHQSCAS